jgi:predicted RNA binding protein YcfA (HicA-like mRNA interferase family)
MSRRLRRLTSRELLAALGRLGFEVVAVRGSHAKLRRVAADGSRQVLTIPLHRDLAPGTIQAILRQASRFVPLSELEPIFFRDP